MNTTYTFDMDIFSDLYKDAHGIRPRGHFFYSEECTDDERQAIWDQTLVALERAIAEEQADRQEALVAFKRLLEVTVSEYGATDEETALRWLTENEKFYGVQDIEHWVWKAGILFTDYGRELVERLKSMVTIEEWS